MNSTTSSGERLTVLVVINRIGAQGGAERSTQEVIEGLSERGFRFVVFSVFPDRDPAASDLLRASGVTTHVGPDGFLRRALALRRLMRRERVDLVHSVLFDADMVTRAATAFSGTPTLCSLVSTQYTEEAMAAARSRWRLQVVRALDAVSGRLLVQRFHAVSEPVADHACRKLGVPRRRIRVVRRGRDPLKLGERSEDRRARVRESLGLTEDGLVLLTLGRQEPAKDHETLVRAASAVVRDRPDTMLLIAGSEGNSTPAVRAVIEELGMTSKVRMLGARPDVGDLLSACDVFVLSSRWEGSPGAVIEALAMGVPVVSTDVPAAIDVVAGNGLLVPVGNHVAMADAILETIRDPKASQRRAAAGVEDFRRRFALEAMLDGMADLYVEVGSLRRRRR